MCFLGLAAALEIRGRGKLSAAALGVSVAGSQFTWLVYPLFAYHYAKTERVKEMLVSLLFAAALIIPFLAWNPNAFVFDTILFEFVRPAQKLLTPMPLGFNANPTLNGLALTFFGAGIPAYLRALLAVAALVIAVRRSNDLRSLFFNATWLLLLSIWLLPNDFSPWYLELPFQMFLTWLVLRGNAPPSGSSPKT